MVAGLKMPRIFHRVLSFEIEGEIYDLSTSPESIIKGYSWNLHKGSNNSDEISLVAKHRDNRGRISKINKLAKINKSSTPDTNYFLI